MIPEQRERPKARKTKRRSLILGDKLELYLLHWISLPRKLGPCRVNKHLKRKKMRKTPKALKMRQNEIDWITLKYEQSRRMASTCWWFFQV
jgi:hypothetical protein